MPGDRARKLARKGERQARGTARNTRELAGSFAFDEVLPAGLTSFLSELMMLVPHALGRSTPRRQIFASTTLIILAIIATPFSFGWSLIVALPAGVTLIIGFMRLVPAANSTFARLRGRRLRDRDIPLWKRD